MPNSCYSIGGQAVLEGVMMKGRHEYAVAVRTPEGTIRTEMTPYESWSARYKALGVPFIRGIVGFIESLTIGMKTLTFSAEIGMTEEEKAQEKEHSPLVNKLLMTGTVLFSICLALAIFVVLPSLIGSLIEKVIPVLWVTNLIEGFLRMIIFLLYIVLISRMKDIRRVFEYHGAEHKTINCYESGRPLTPENAKECTRLHKRCGTSFLFIIMFISILLFMVIQVHNPLLKVLYRLALIPAVASISYEVLKLSAKYDNKFLTALVYPGLLLQKLTTCEPDLEQLEVAIQSFQAVLEKEIEHDAA